MRIHIETERLLLRDIEEYDSDGLYALDSNPEVHQFLGNKPIETVGEAKALIAFIRRQYQDYGIGRWAVIEKETGEFLGWSGLKYITEPINEHINYYDLGYRFLKKYWGRGFATEAAFASINYAIEVLQVSELYAIADVNNLASHKVLHKVGFIEIERFQYLGVPHKWYSLVQKG